VLKDLRDDLIAASFLGQSEGKVSIDSVVAFLLRETKGERSRKKKIKSPKLNNAVAKQEIVFCCFGQHCMHRPEGGMRQFYLQGQYHGLLVGDR
jgi:hypothetical protein